MLRPSVLKILILGILSPGAALALGLGDIHVESALHQPLAAQIEIVGAGPENSAGLSATIADADTFQRYGLERPASLASTALTVRQDGQGHTVLFLRSTDSFTEPMVTLLVDLHSASGELIREYTILLDPPAFAPEQAAVSSATAQQVPARGSTPTTTVESAFASASATAQTPNAEAKSPTLAATAAREATADKVQSATNTYTVARRDTLARIASIAGAHSRSDRRRMMIAIFRANPSAFQTNLNNLRTGVTLHLPNVAELVNIPADEANREFAAQMTAWRSSDHHSPLVAATSAAPRSATPNSAAPPSATTSANPRSAANSAVPAPAASASFTASANHNADVKAVADVKADIEAHKAETVALTQRIATLEKSLDEVRQKLQHPPAQQPAVAQQQLVEQRAAEPTHAVESTAVASTSAVEPTPAAKSAPAIESTPVPVAATEQYADNFTADDEPVPAPRHRNWLVTLAIRVGLVFAAGIGLALALIAGVWLYRRRKDDDSSVESDFAMQEPVRRDPDSYRAVETDDTPVPFSKVDISASYLVEELKHEAEHANAAARSDADTDARATEATEATVAINAAETIDATVKLPIEETVKLPTPRSTAAETTAVLALHPDLTLDDTAAREFAFFNPESSLNTTHVMIAADPLETTQIVERRKNPADVLRQAIEREPERSDLRLKLLELYYSAAAQNRRAFLEAVRQLAKNDKLVASANDWSQIEDMGRAIAPDDELFSNGLTDNKKAVA
jgi:pilus assembly protein FimV